MILATASGWLIAGTVVRETKNNYVFKAIDSDTERKVKKSSQDERLFDDASIAMDWIDNVNKSRLL